ncbi:protein TIFY 3-like isoform X2 [Tripterygium wilfordii]|uniref:protein TIFY 3-like isoform X2 n=1 Tax=Tripterygium wilfordii TaxID=458696 RepID=UPI0018F84EAC|nr:protein TIFY 3-like isoform X2 [Tripterygium wilfordii]
MAGPEVKPIVEVEQVKKEQEVIDSVPAAAAGGGSDLDLTEFGSGKGNDKLVQKDDTRPPTMKVSGTNAPAQLTIFYGERVFVFDSIPFEKVGEIVRIAAAASPGDVKNIGTGGPATKPILSRSPSLLSTATPLASPQIHMPSCKLQAAS